MDKFEYYNIKWKIRILETKLKRIEVEKQPSSLFKTKAYKEKCKILEIEEEEIMSNLKLLYTEFEKLCQIKKED